MIYMIYMIHMSYMIYDLDSDLYYLYDLYYLDRDLFELKPQKSVDNVVMCRTFLLALILSSRMWSTTDFCASVSPLGLL